METKRQKQKVIAKYHHTGRGIVTGRLENNPVSINCNIYVLESGESATVFKLKRWHEGHAMMAHGGITASVLDEVMGYSNHAREYVEHLKYTPVFTGTVTYKYIRPVMVGEEYHAVGRIDSIEGRKRFITGEIMTPDGEVCVIGEGVFLTAKELEDSNEHVAFEPLSESDPKEI